MHGDTKLHRSAAGERRVVGKCYKLLNMKIRELLRFQIQDPVHVHTEPERRAVPVRESPRDPRVQYRRQGTIQSFFVFEELAPSDRPSRIVNEIVCI